MELTDHIGPWLPLVPAFAILFLFLEIRQPIVGAVLFLPLVYFGPNIIQQPVIRWKIIKMHIRTVDKRGRKRRYTVCLFVTRASAAYENTILFETHWLTKLYSPLIDASVQQFYLTAFDFDISHLPFVDGEADFLGYPLESGNVCELISWEVASDVATDKHQDSPKYLVRLVDREALEMERSIGI